MYTLNDQLRGEARAVYNTTAWNFIMGDTTASLANPDRLTPLSIGLVQRTDQNVLRTWWADLLPQTRDQMTARIDSLRAAGDRGGQWLYQPTPVWDDPPTINNQFREAGLPLYKASQHPHRLGIRFLDPEGRAAAEFQAYMTLLSCFVPVAMIRRSTEGVFTLLTPRASATLLRRLEFVRQSLEEDEPFLNGQGDASLLDVWFESVYPNSHRWEVLHSQFERYQTARVDRDGRWVDASCGSFVGIELFDCSPFDLKWTHRGDHYEATSSTVSEGYTRALSTGAEIYSYLPPADQLRSTPTLEGMRPCLQDFCAAHRRARILPPNYRDSGLPNTVEYGVRSYPEKGEGQDVQEARAYIEVGPPPNSGYYTLTPFGPSGAAHAWTTNVGPWSPGIYVANAALIEGTRRGAHTAAPDAEEGYGEEFDHYCDSCGRGDELVTTGYRMVTIRVHDWEVIDEGEVDDNAGDDHYCTFCSSNGSSPEQPKRHIECTSCNWTSEDEDELSEGRNAWCWFTHCPACGEDTTPYSECSDA
jgi:hypothetical protein